MCSKLNSKELFERVVKFKWLITDVNGAGFDEYTKGNEFSLTSDNNEEFESIGLSQNQTDLPYFLCIKPTWFVRDGVLYLTLIAGNKPQGLTRIVMWFDKLDSSNPEFKFELTSLLDNPFRGADTLETGSAEPTVYEKSDESCIATSEMAIQANVGVRNVLRASGGDSNGIRGMGIGH